MEEETRHSALYVLIDGSMASDMHIRISAKVNLSLNQKSIRFLPIFSGDLSGGIR